MMIAYPLRVLFIEDDINQAKGLAKLIERKIAPATIEAFYETNLECGVEASNRLLPCVTFLDLVYPAHLNWEDAAKTIPDIKGAVIVATELESPKVEIECRANGAFLVLNKKSIPGIINLVTYIMANIRINALARTSVTKTT